MSQNIENYNLINYLKIVDLSLLNLFDYLDLDENKLLVEIDGKLVLNFTSKTKKMFETFVTNNINDQLFLGKTNILVDTCSPTTNWRRFNENIKLNDLYKYEIADESIYIDKIKLNNIANAIFKKIFYNIVTKHNVLSKNIHFLNFKCIDVYDVFSILISILKNFGAINKDTFNYNLIKDGNSVFLHGSSFSDYLVDSVRLELINKGII